MQFRIYSNTITAPVEKKALQAGLVILGVSNLGRKQVTIEVEPTSDTYQFEALISKKGWRLTTRQHSNHLELIINKRR